MSKKIAGKVVGVALIIMAVVFVYVNIKPSGQSTNEQGQKAEQEKQLKTEENLWKSKNFGKKLEPLTFEK